MPIEQIYTVGCFDYFHHGHEELFELMQSICNNIVVCIHDDESIEQLKNLTPDQHQDIKQRIANIQKYTTNIHVIHSKDPSAVLEDIIDKDLSRHQMIYMRGDDMPNFPGRDVVEKYMHVLFKTYKKGVSSTEIRKRLNNQHIDSNNYPDHN